MLLVHTFLLSYIEYRFAFLLKQKYFNHFILDVLINTITLKLYMELS